jgi:hypothetical protein
MLLGVETTGQPQGPAEGGREYRRNGHYVCIRGVTRSITAWARLCGIGHPTLCMMHRRHGTAVMVRAIKAGLRGDYDPLWWHNRAGKGVIRDPKTRDKRRCLTIADSECENVS